VRRTVHRGRLGLLLAGVLSLAALAPPAHGAEPRTSLPDVEDEVMCPICGTTLELSEAPQAERERALIRRLIVAGRTKEEIKEVLVAEYGPEVLALPEGEGFDLTAWVIPGAAILLAAGLLGLGLIRVRSRSASEDGERPPLPRHDARALDDDLGRYDL
jgi:cytochrome c-type biogenesis protein CcmH